MDSGPLSFSRKALVPSIDLSAFRAALDCCGAGNDPFFWKQRMDQPGVDDVFGRKRTSPAIPLFPERNPDRACLLQFSNCGKTDRGPVVKAFRGFRASRQEPWCGRFESFFWPHPADVETVAGVRFHSHFFALPQQFPHHPGVRRGNPSHHHRSTDLSAGTNRTRSGRCSGSGTAPGIDQHQHSGVVDPHPVCPGTSQKNLPAVFAG